MMMQSDRNNCVVIFENIIQIVQTDLNSYNIFKLAGVIYAKISGRNKQFPNGGCTLRHFPVSILCLESTDK